MSLAESQHCHFAVKRFLVVREIAGAVSGVACFWATSLEKISGGVIAIISFRPGGWMQQSAGGTLRSGLYCAKISEII